MLALVFSCIRQTGTTQKSAAPSEPVETVSLCQLTLHWDKYDHRIVRIEANFLAEFEIAEVYDPSCPTRSENTAWVEYGSPDPVPTELAGKLRRLLKERRRARITVVGEFDGPRKVETPPGISPEAADIMRKTNSRYGHLNGWRFQFIFSKVEKVEPARATDSWPTWPPAENQVPD
jgi:hypothetical protein